MRFGISGLVGVGLLVLSCTNAATPVAPETASALEGYEGPGESVVGFVFEDRNGDGRRQADREPGVEGVLVSNGRHVVETDGTGRYALPNIYDHGPEPTKPGAMTVFITKPADFDVPLDQDNVPQFSYHHIPDGSPPNVRGEPLRFGGLPPSGPLPKSLDFPLLRGKKRDRFRVIVSGDTQTYSNNEVGYLRDSAVNEWAAVPDAAALIVEGDILGDDLSLFPRFKRALSMANTPQYYVPGNHDLDFDAPTHHNSFDTFKREWGPAYYSFDLGDVHFVVLSDVHYPCTSEDNHDGLHPDCDHPEDKPTYNAVVPGDQIRWLKNDLAYVPEGKRIVLNSHIPIYSFVSQNSARQALDNAGELFETVGCARAADGTFPPENCARPVLALSGHTHTLEQIRPGEVYAGWQEALGPRAPGPSPFPQIVTGAACGSWWSGDFDSGVIPESWQRDGAPPGYLEIEFDGADYRDTFKATGMPAGRQMSIDLLTPGFLAWFTALAEWRLSNPDARAVPPHDINDLPDTKQVLMAELAETRLSVNFWNGSRDSVVEVRIDAGEPLILRRTQQGEGEEIARTLDPFALKRQMMVARYAYATQGDPRANGWESSRGTQRCPHDGGAPCTPRPTDPFLWSTASTHIWQVPLPESLSEGFHLATVRATDRHGRAFVEQFVFEVVAERVAPFWNEQNFEALP